MFAVWLRHNVSHFRHPQYPVVAWKHVRPVSLLQPPNYSGQNTLQVSSCCFFPLWSNIVFVSLVDWGHVIIMLLNRSLCCGLSLHWYESDCFFVSCISLSPSCYSSLLPHLEEWALEGTVNISLPTSACRITPFKIIFLGLDIIFSILFLLGIFSNEIVWLSWWWAQLCYEINWFSYILFCMGIDWCLAATLWNLRVWMYFMEAKTGHTDFSLISNWICYCEM